MRKFLKYMLILVFLVLIFIILNILNSKNNIYDDILILGLWNDIGYKNKYEITSEDFVVIDIFSTINKKRYKKIAPGSSGSFLIKFKRPLNSNYQINIIEKTKKPQNLVFILDNKKYTSLEELEEKVNEKFINTEKIIINWEWEYYISKNKDIQDTEDGQNAERYLFEVCAIVEREERT